MLYAIYRQLALVLVPVYFIKTLGLMHAYVTCNILFCVCMSLCRNQKVLEQQLERYVHIDVLIKYCSLLQYVLHYTDYSLHAWPAVHYVHSHARVPHAWDTRPWRQTSLYTVKNDVWFWRRVCGYCGKRAFFPDIVATIVTHLHQNHTPFFSVIYVYTEPISPMCMCMHECII